MKKNRHFLIFLIVTGLVFCIAGGAWSADQGQKINLNTATVEQLVQLKGIGPAIAERIVVDRKAKGAFNSVDDLARVKGIGPKTIAAIRDQITVGAPEKMPEPEKE